MVYGDLQFFDLIIFAAIAVFLIFRLSKVLGKRTGFQKNSTNKKIIKNSEQSVKKNTPQLKENEAKLSLAYEVYENFDHKKFLEGAKFAFETIINAFNNSDKKTLKNLLTPEVFNSFEAAIDQGNNNPNYQFYSLIIDEVKNVVVEKKLLKITISIISEQFKNDDESTIMKKKDIWTFQRDINSKSPQWYLSAT